MANFKFNRTTTTNMKIAGLLDTDRMVINVDGEDKLLATLLSPFNGAECEVVIKIKQDEPQNA